MESKKCTHIRIRDSNYYDINVEKFIKSLEAKHKIDFRCLPRWEELVQRMHVADTDCKRKIQAAQWRKGMIIDKLYMQATRPSPFELSLGLCRTASKWRKMEADLKKRRISETPEPVLETEISSESVLGEQSEAHHPNTMVTSPENLSVHRGPSKVDAELQVEIPEPHLPVVICTNPHKLISPLGSEFSEISYKSPLQIPSPLESIIEEWRYLPPTSSVVCVPTPILVTKNTLKQQFVKFTVINHANEFRHIRFQCIMDSSPFLTKKILPAIPKILYPGVPHVYRFIFKLKDQRLFDSGLFFKVGQDVCNNVPPEAFCIPVVSSFLKKHSVLVSETINIPPVYPWHVRRNGQFSTATLKLSVNDPYTYHLHIYKRLVDLSKVSEVNLSLQATGLNSESEEEREMDVDAEAMTFVSSVKSQPRSESINIIESMNFIVESAIEVALDTFVFKSTYLFLKPYEKVKIPVYLAKNERIGYHNSYYELEFLEPKTERLIMSKTIKVFAEVLPHPLKIHPNILDMSNSPVTHGYTEERFIITNTHKLYLAAIKIKLTTKMKKIFRVDPMETTVPALQSVPFTVRFCTNDLLSDKPVEDFAYFTFKIVVVGHKSLYENVPPFFYEVITPCAAEFKKIYNETYFKEVNSELLVLALN